MLICFRWDSRITSVSSTGKMIGKNNEVIIRLDNGLATDRQQAIM